MLNEPLYVSASDLYRITDHIPASSVIREHYAAEHIHFQPLKKPEKKQSFNSVASCCFSK